VEGKLLLSPDETCETLGVKRGTLFKLLASGEIPSIKLGKLRRIPREGLTDWVKRQVDQQARLEDSKA
jgi:excisionase family DNA binding protein